jgi:predicted phage tail protein
LTFAFSEMPPKDDKAVKKKKKEKPPAVVVGEEGMSEEEILRKKQMQLESLERQLIHRTEESDLARAEEQELREKCEQLQRDYDAVQMERFDIISDFTRQHKSMQDELIARITVLENTICDLKDQLELSRIALDETRKEKDQIIAQKDKEIAEQEQKMAEMTDEFHEMLKNTLDKMSERIEHTIKSTAKAAILSSKEAAPTIATPGSPSGAAGTAAAPSSGQSSPAPPMILTTPSVAST